MPKTKTAAAVGFAFILSCFSCATLNPEPPDTATATATDRMSAEYSQIKKRLPLLERENEVLKEESLNYREKVRRLDDTCVTLASGLSVLNDKFEQASALNAEKNCSLQQQIDLNRQLGIEELKAQGLSSQGLAEKLSAQIRELNQSMAAQKVAFDKKLGEQLAAQKSDLGKALDEQAAALKNDLINTTALAQAESDRKQTELAAQIDFLKKGLSSKDAEIAALQKTAGDVSSKLNAAAVQIEEINRVRMELQSELEMVKAVETDLLEQLKTLSDQFHKKSVVLK